MQAASDERTTDRQRRTLARPTIVAVSGLLGAFGALSCCVLPLALFSVGVGGAWLSNLTALSRYQPLLVGLTLGMLGIGFWLIRRQPRSASCSEAADCSSASSRLIKGLLWTSVALVAIALAFPYAAPLLLT